MAAKKKVAKKAAKKVAKKSGGPAARKAAKKPVKKATKKAAKKAPAKAAKKAAKKAPAKAAKKVAAKKATAKSAPAKKAAVKKAAARKAAVKKVAAVKPAPPKKKVPVKPAKPVKLTAFVKAQRQNLLDLRDELMDVMYGVQHDTLLSTPEGAEASGSGMHQGDAGSDAYDRDFALSLLSKEQDAIQEIQAALERIEIGTYGICEISGRKIPQARLEAIPFARLTVECQAQWEAEHPHKQFSGIQTDVFGVSNIDSVSLDEAV